MHRESLVLRIATTSTTAGPLKPSYWLRIFRLIKKKVKEEHVLIIIRFTFPVIQNTAQHKCQFVQLRF